MNKNEIEKIFNLNLNFGIKPLCYNNKVIARNRTEWHRVIEKQHVLKNVTLIQKENNKIIQTLKGGF